MYLFTLFHLSLPAGPDEVRRTTAVKRRCGATDIAGPIWAGSLSQQQVDTLSSVPIVPHTGNTATSMLYTTHPAIPRLHVLDLGIMNPLLFLILCRHDKLERLR